MQYRKNWAVCRHKNTLQYCINCFAVNKDLKRIKELKINFVWREDLVWVTFESGDLQGGKYMLHAHRPLYVHYTDHPMLSGIFS